MIVDCISMDLLGHEPLRWVEMVQGDLYSRKLKIILYSGRKVWNVPEDTAVLIRYRKGNDVWGEYDTMPDGNVAWEADGNVLTLSIVPQITSAPGIVQLSVIFLKEEAVLNSFSVEIRVRKNIQGIDSCRVDREAGYRCVTGFLPAPETGKVGQIIQISAVDKAGKVREVTAADMPAGGVGESGGYYTPVLTQTDADTLRISHLPSHENMPTVAEVQVRLPAGKDGSDGVTAYQYAQSAGYDGTEEDFAAKLAEGPFCGATSDVTPAQVAEAVLSGRDVVLSHMDPSFGEIFFTGFVMVPAMDVVASSGVNEQYQKPMRFCIAGSISTGLWYFSYNQLADITDIPEIPSALPNPNTLSFTGAVTGTYDGSSPVTINIPTVSGGSSGETIPEYVRTEAEVVARVVNQHQNNDSIIFPFLADAHCGYYYDQGNEATKLAGQLLNLIGMRVPYDFIVNGGDMSSGAYDTTRELTFEYYEDYTELTAEGQKGVPVVWVPGNHDDAPYRATAERATQKDVFALIGRKSRVSGAVCLNGCNYGYLDLENRKLRVIYLDTDDKRSWGTVQVGASDTAPAYLNAHNVGGEQLQWLVDTGLDFTDKENPAQWSVVVVSHVVLNIGGTITDAVSGTTYAHSTANAATILNAYRTGKSGSITHNDITIDYDFSAVESKATVICAVHGHDHKFCSETLTGGILSIGCPNVMNGRERESDDGNIYTKTAGTADGTSFCILTIDRENCMIYADCVGAGYDREFAYTTEAASYTNQLAISTDASGNVYNGKGFKEDTYLSSGNEGTRTGIYTTGFIPCKLGDTLYCKNVGMQTGQDGHRLCFYNADKTFTGTLIKTSNTGYTGLTYGDDGNISMIGINVSGDNENTAFVRFCCSYLGEDSIVTANELII